MENDKRFENLFQAFRVSFMGISAYSPEHPVFLKSLQNLITQVESIAGESDSVKFGVSPTSIRVGDEFLQEKEIFKQIASKFHRIGIKSVEIKSGVERAELIDFLSMISLPQQEITKRGGIQKIAGESLKGSIRVEGMDYSSVLTGAGDASPDVWINLLSDSVVLEDPDKLERVVSDFKDMVEKLRLQEIVENPELYQKVQRFFDFLHEKEAGSYQKCVKDFMGAILSDQSVSGDVKVEQIRDLFKDVNEDDFAEMLWEEIVGNDSFDSHTFQLFSQLVDESKQDGVAESFERRLSTTSKTVLTPRIRRKLKEIFSSRESSKTSEVYRRTLAGFLDNLSFEPERTLDQAWADENYRIVLLDMLHNEEKKDRIPIIMGKAIEEAARLSKEDHHEYARHAADLYAKKRELGVSMETVLEHVKPEILHALEEDILERGNHSNYGFVLEGLKESGASADLYLNRLLDGSTVSPLLLKLFLQNHPGHLPAFLDRLKARGNDDQYQIDLLQGLGEIDELETATRYQIMKSLYWMAGHNVQGKVLDRMEGLPEVETGFLLGILKSGTVTCKRKAIRLMQEKAGGKIDPCETLLAVPNPFGRNTSQLLSNLDVFQDGDFEEAIPFLQTLSKRKFFWNRKVREKAYAILGRYDESAH